jgi:hypothetical protein
MVRAKSARAASARANTSVEKRAELRVAAAVPAGRSSDVANENATTAVAATTDHNTQ